MELTQIQNHHIPFSVLKMNVSALVTSFVQLLDVGLWIGLSRVSEYEPWLWSDNSQFLYSNWAPGEPTANVRIINLVDTNNNQEFPVLVSSLYDLFAVTDSETLQGKGTGNLYSLLWWSPFLDPFLQEHRKGGAVQLS